MYGRVGEFPYLIWKTRDTQFCLGRVEAEEMVDIQLEIIGLSHRIVEQWSKRMLK